MDYLKIVNYILETSLVGSLLVVLILALRLIFKYHIKNQLFFCFNLIRKAIAYIKSCSQLNKLYECVLKNCC
ncbi:hypothetical protein [Clostridium tertium]|uniref:hypothetical protein n=1 Tax=Clostridium tertium TaxID=1559 RepID=UPI0024B3A80C|nr:hypothetical protein [Clostridium tertium]MDI9218538.1 hypothetical protein [Clostridium tertium]